MSSHELSLTPAMREHLIELVDAPFWQPTDSGEWSVARALARRGYLSRNPDRGVQAYELTEAGRIRGEAEFAALTDQPEGDGG